MKTIHIPILAAVFLLSVSCGSDTGDTGVAGPQGPVGPQGDPGAPGTVGTVATWSTPANASGRVVTDSVDSRNPVGVYTSDGRSHVVFLSYDSATSRDQLYYTTAAAPYSSWLTAVRVTTNATYTPAEFDVATAADGSIHVVFTRPNGTDNTVFHTANTAAALGTFTETTVYAETHGNSLLFTPKVLMRATTAHVTWVNHYDMLVTDRIYYQYSENSSGGFPVSPITLADSRDVNDYSQVAFASDAAGNFHLAFFFEAASLDDYIYYRQLPAASTTWSAVDQVSADSATSDVRAVGEAPFFRFDSSDNVFLFWEQDDASSNASIYFNIKAAAAATFDKTKATNVTLEPNGDGWYQTPWSLIGEIKVDSAGNVYTVWKSNGSYGTYNGLYTIFYRRKAFNIDPTVGWGAAEVAARHYGEASTGGNDRTCRVAIAPNGTSHVFWTDYPDYMTEVWHSYKASGSTVWKNGGIVSSPTYSYYYGIGNLDGSTYMIDVGLEADGTPYALLALDPSYLDGDVGYTSRQNGLWLIGRIIDSNYHTDTWGDFWVGTDPSGGLHALWQEEVDPFNNDGVFDLVHSHR